MRNISVEEATFWENILILEGLGEIDSQSSGIDLNDGENDIIIHNSKLKTCERKLQEMEDRFQDLQFHRWLAKAFD